MEDLIGSLEGELRIIGVSGKEYYGEKVNLLGGGVLEMNIGGERVYINISNIESIESF